MANFNILKAEMVKLESLHTISKVKISRIHTFKEIYSFIKIKLLLSPLKFYKVHLCLRMRRNWHTDNALDQSSVG